MKIRQRNSPQQAPRWWLKSLVILGCSAAIFTISTRAFAAEGTDAAKAAEVGKTAIKDLPENPGDLTLVNVITLAAATTNVDLARLESAIAREEVGAQRTALLPRLDAIGTLKRADDIPRFPGDTAGPISTNEGRLRLGQAIVDLNAWYATDAARRQLEAEEAALSLATDEAMLAAARGFLNLLVTDALILVRQQDLTLAEDLFRQATAQVDLGASDPIAATRAASQVAAAKSALLTAEGRHQRATIDLARLLDLRPDTDLRSSEILHDNLVPVSPFISDPSAAEEFALGNRSEMQVSSATLAALDLAIEAARGQGLPRLEAFGEAGYGGVWDSDDDTGWNLGLSLSIPLVNDTRYRTDQARLRHQQQSIRKYQLELQIRSQVRNTITTINTAGARLVAGNDRRELAQTELAQAEARFAQGLAGNLAVVQAQRSRSAAELTYLQALSALIEARMQFIAALGSIQALAAQP
jgi:outer membrane protein TolC